MKIVDRPTVAPARLPPPPRAADTTGAFEALLRGEDQARGFRDLGMFGRRPGADRDLDLGPKSGSEIATAAETQEEVSAFASSPEAQRPVVASHLVTYAEAVARAAAREAIIPSPTIDRVSISVDQVALAAADITPRQAPSGADAAGPERAAPVVQRLRLTTGPGFSLVVADHQGALRVAIGGLAATTSALARLRLKIAELAVEFGLNLSELSVNGDRLEASTLPIPGGAHGDHAR